MQKSEASKQLKNSEDQYKVICMSTGHITEQDARRLGSMAGEHSMIMEREAGFLVKLYMDNDSEENLERDYPGMSHEFYDILSLTRECGFQMVEFDRDATLYESVPSFNW